MNFYPKLKEKDSKQLDVFLLLLIGIPCIIILILVFTHVYYTRTSLKGNGITRKGIVTGFHSSSKSSYFLDYSFSVNGIQYTGRGRYYPKLPDRYFIGDSILIIYDAKEPTTNMTYRDFVDVKMYPF